MMYSVHCTRYSLLAPEICELDEKMLQSSALVIFYLFVTTISSPTIPVSSTAIYIQYIVISPVSFQQQPFSTIVLELL